MPLVSDEVEEMGLGLLGEVEQRLGALEAVAASISSGQSALAGAHLAAIAARGAVAEAVRFDQDRDVDAGRGRDEAPPTGR